MLPQLKICVLIRTLLRLHFRRRTPFEPSKLISTRTFPQHLDVRHWEFTRREHFLASFLLFVSAADRWNLSLLGHTQ